MRKVLWTALACLAAAVLALLAVRLGVQAAVPAYPASLGGDPIPEKITGETLIRAAAAQDDTLTVFGSSELKTTDICTHPANFFAGKRCGFQVNLVGRGSCQSLVHAMAIAASGESLRGKKVVLITAPQSYTAEGIAPDLFMANFSEQQMLTLLQDKTLPAESRRYLAARVQALTEAYNAENGTQLQAHTAAGLLTRAAAADRSAACALLTPYAALSRWLLDTKDLVTASAAMRAAPEAKEPAGSADIDWQQEEEAALALGATRWEMVKLAVLPFGKSGVVSASMLGLGRALGETMAVLMILSPGLNYTFKLLQASQNQTIAANIAAQYPEANALGVSALIGTGLVLFLITFVVNFIARKITEKASA